LNIGLAKSLRQSRQSRCHLLLPVTSAGFTERRQHHIRHEILVRDCRAIWIAAIAAAYDRITPACSAQNLGSVFSKGGEGATRLLANLHWFFFHFYFLFRF
jgi:hypothetical protein